MSLKENINKEITTAMKAKDQDLLTALRSIKSMILLAETESGRSQELNEADESKILMKAAKQRKDSAEIFKAQGRDDLYVKEIAELKVIERFLPQMLSQEDIAAEIAKIIAQTGAKGPADMGKVMGAATKAMAGKAEGAAISATVKKMLAEL